uniref:Uncharacterized protein n=1 Tax=Anopheles atroparvus TaxID=41427 RepID=A0AAG5DMP7_ANOAO
NDCVKHNKRKHQPIRRAVVRSGVTQFVVFCIGARANAPTTDGSSQQIQSWRLRERFPSRVRCWTHYSPNSLYEARFHVGGWSRSEIWKKKNLL